jgi:hypothetical protein
MRIAFHDNSLCLRGTTVAIYDWAYWTRHYLDIDPIIMFNLKNNFNDKSVIKKFENEFPVFGYEDKSQIDDILSKNKCDAFLMEKGGNSEIKSFLNQSSDTLYHSKATSIPSLYKLHSAYRLLEEYENKNKIKYDIVIKTRPDFLHVHTDIEKYFDRIHDTLFHINTGITYCPNRVYEMFLLSSSSIMKTVCESWLNFNQLVSTDYSLHMTRLDACRLVYSQCVLNNIKIDTFEKVLGDVLRIENYLDYQSFENMFI